MKKWDILIRHKPYITDLGKNCTMEFHMIHAVVGRYIVWLPMAGVDRHFIAEEGNDLEELMKKYDIPFERIQRLGPVMDEETENDQ